MSNIKQLVTGIAFDLGFHGIGISLANDLDSSNKNFLEWREKGYAADMNYLLREDPINAKPRRILNEAKSIITLMVNYYTECPPDPGPDYGRVATYAVGLDYHKVIRKKIKQFQEKIQKEVGGCFISKGFSDSVPLLEKSVAQNSGLGFRGKHTLIINKVLGSYFFISELISNLDLEPTEKASGTCGSCTRCIDICPTQALGVGTSPDLPSLDSRKCISYQTIENRSMIPEEIRNGIGEWLFGCDLCQIACPYNNIKSKKIKETDWKEFCPESGVGHWIKLSDILSIKTEDEFHYKFCRTPLTRSKRSGLLRNAAIVAANKKSEESLPHLKWLAENENDLVIREHARWALSEYETKHHFKFLINSL